MHLPAGPLKQLVQVHDARHGPVGREHLGGLRKQASSAQKRGWSCGRTEEYPWAWPQRRSPSLPIGAQPVWWFDPHGASVRGYLRIHGYACRVCVSV